MKKWSFASVFTAACIAAGIQVAAQTCGVLWQAANPRPTSNDLSAVAYGNGQFVAVGSYDTILTSADGASWTRRASDTDASYTYLQGVAWDGSRFVAVGYSGYLLTSPDGVRWSSRETGMWNTLYGVASGGGLTVVVGSSGVILTSSDGVEWTQRSSWTTSSLTDVTYGNGTFVAVGGSAVVTSPNGITWTPVSGPSGAYFYDVAYGASKFVASLSGSQVATSSDGQTWTASGTGLSSYINKIAYDGSQFVAVCSSGVVATSPDGTTWTAHTGASKALYGICRGGGTYTAVGAQGTVVTSTDGVQWKTQGGSDGSWNLNAAASSGTLTVAVGDNGAIVTSTDLASWTQQTSGTASKLMSAAYGGGTFVVGGFNATVLTSTDGVTWTVRDPGVANHFLGVTFLNGKFYATGDAGMLMTSADGAAWTSLVSNTSEDLYSVAYGGGRFVAVGNNGAVVSSSDGDTWTAQTLSGVDLLEQVIYAGNQFVAVGNGVAVSADGLSWTTRWTSLTGVAYSSGIYVGITSGGYTYTSLDGLSWSSCPYDSSGSASAVTLSGPAIVAVGAGGRILTGFALPVITSVAPTSGTMSGGTSVTINGGGFTGATGVGFGDKDATSFTVNSSTRITATSPPNACGPVRISVASARGRSLSNGSCDYTYYGVPVITALNPATGPSTGYNYVTIEGSNMTMASAVHFGSTQAYSFSVLSSHAINVYVPPHPTGTVDVTVTTPAGTSATGDASKYTYFPMPDISTLSPNSGSTAGGTTVTVTGSGFTGATSVKFGSVDAASFTVDSDTQVTAVTPAQGAGWVSVYITNAHGTNPSYDAQFGYFDPPSLAGISPTSGSTSGGTTVAITGTNLSGATAVRFGGISANFYANSSTQLTAYSPAHAAGTVDVIVTTGGGTTATSAASKFTYVAPAPAVSSLVPTSGSTSGGTSVTIYGSGLMGATAVRFGTVSAASFTVANGSTIYALSPAHGPGTVDVTVTTSGGTSTASAASKFSFTPPVPVIAAVSPASGPTTGGTTVTISGTGLTGASAVRFGSIVATSFTVSSDTAVTAVSPAEGAGTVDVTVTTAGGTSAASSGSKFTYSMSVPAVSYLAPAQGPSAGGTTVTIVGANFIGVSHVTFGGVQATSFTVDNPTGITAVSPPHAAGAVTVTVSGSGGTSAPSAGSTFTYVAPPPTIGSLTPARGSTGGGTSVVITGSGFQSGATVLFGGAPGSGVVLLDGTSLTVTTPGLPAGTVDVTVRNPDGQEATLPAAFTFVPPPSISGVTKVSGPIRLKISGAGFQPSSLIQINGTDAPLTVYKSGTALVAKGGASLKALLPKGVTVQVTVVNPADGTLSAPVPFTR